MQQKQDRLIFFPLFSPNAAQPVNVKNVENDDNDVDNDDISAKKCIFETNMSLQIFKSEHFSAGYRVTKDLRNSTDFVLLKHVYLIIHWAQWYLVLRLSCMTL